MIKRILKFDSKDWKHLWGLFKSMVIQFFKGDLLDAKDAWYFIRLHLEHDSKRIN